MDFLYDWRSDIEISIAIGQLDAVRDGAGVGICHGFMVAGSTELVRLFPNLSVTRSYLFVWHENQAVDQHIQAVTELLDITVKDVRHLFETR